MAPNRAPLAVATLGWNPLFLLVSVGGAHNDVLVSLGVLLALRVVLRGSTRPTDRWWDVAAVAVLTLTVLVKVIAVVPLLLFVLGRIMALRGARSRGVFLLAATVAVAVPVAILSKPVLGSGNESLGLLSVTRYATPIAPAALLSRLANLPFRWINSEAARSALDLALLILPAIYFCFLFARLVRKLRRCPNPAEGSVQGTAWGFALICLPLASPLLFPWYLAAGLPLAWLLPEKSDRIVVAIAILLTIPAAVIREQPFRDTYNLLMATGSTLIAGSLLISFVILGLQALRQPLEGSVRAQPGPLP